jgi:hypothetical protein
MSPVASLVLNQSSEERMDYSMKGSFQHQASQIMRDAIDHLPVEEQLKAMYQAIDALIRSEMDMNRLTRHVYGERNGSIQ